MPTKNTLTLEKRSLLRSAGVVVASLTVFSKLGAELLTHLSQAPILLQSAHLSVYATSLAATA